MTETLLNSTANVTIAGQQVVFKIGELNITLDVLLQVLNYVMVGILGVMLGIVLFALWNPFTRVVIKNAIGKRLGFLHWDYVLLGRDTGGTINLYEHNLYKSEQFAEVGGAYFLHNSYIKNVNGAPFIMYADQDARPLTSKYEQLVDKEGWPVYFIESEGRKIKVRVFEVIKEGVKKIILAHPDGKPMREITSDEIGVTVKEWLKPFAWTHYDLYPPELLDPSKLATGIRINRVENKIAAELAARAGKIVLQAVLIIALATVLGVFIQIYLFTSKSSTWDMTATNTEAIRTAMNITMNRSG